MGRFTGQLPTEGVMEVAACFEWTCGRKCTHRLPKLTGFISVSLAWLAIATECCAPPTSWDLGRFWGTLLLVPPVPESLWTRIRRPFEDIIALYTLDCRGHVA